MKNQTPKEENKKLKKTNMTKDEILWHEVRAENHRIRVDYYQTAFEANFK